MIVSGIKKIINNCFQNYGYEVRKCDKTIKDPFLHQLQLIDGLNKKTITIFDVGAHKGCVTEKYLELFPNARVHSFEPYPKSASILYEKFKNEKRVRIIEKAIAKYGGDKCFFVNCLDATNSLLPRPTNGRRYFPKIASTEKIIKVETISLDEYISQENIKSIDILKFDIQGGEMNAFKGATELLSRINPSIIYTEIMFVPHYKKCKLFNELWSFLIDYNYSLFGIYDLHIAENNQLRYGDALFVNESLRMKVVDAYPEEP